MRIEGVWFGIHPHKSALADATHRVYAVVELERERGFEELWARQIGPAEYVISAVPCYAYELAYGDVVRTEPFFGLNALIVERTSRSGHGSVRVGFKMNDSEEQILSLTRLLGSKSEHHELVSKRWLGLDIATQEQLIEVEAIVKPKEDSGDLFYEFGEVVGM
jgi:hypothetical protein